MKTKEDKLDDKSWDIVKDKHMNGQRIINIKLDRHKKTKIELQNKIKEELWGKEWFKAETEKLITMLDKLLIESKQSK